MKIRLKKSLSLPLVAVALASSTGAMADEGAKLSNASIERRGIKFPIRHQCR
jgi:hypothetical protein